MDSSRAAWVLEMDWRNLPSNHYKNCIQMLAAAAAAANWMVNHKQYFLIIKCEYFVVVKISDVQRLLLKIYSLNSIL